MRKTNIIKVLVICILLVSCSEENTNEELTKDQLLIQNSPWIFDHYEFKKILEGKDLGIEVFENDGNESYFNLELNFYKDGLGSIQYPNSSLVPVNWLLSNDNTLTIIPDPDWDDPASFENVKVSESELIFEFVAFSYDENLETTTHYGVFYFN